jgi:hypothetical protein
VLVERVSLALDLGEHLAVGIIIGESTGMPWPAPRHRLGLIADIDLEKLDAGAPARHQGGAHLF